MYSTNIFVDTKVCLTWLQYPIICLLALHNIWKLLICLMVALHWGWAFGWLAVHQTSPPLQSYIRWEHADEDDIAKNAHTTTFRILKGV